MSDLGLNSFSEFVTEIAAMSRDVDAEELARWSVEELSRIIGFDCAWYGWAEISHEGANIHANASLNLPDDFYEFWQSMSHQDLLAAQMHANPDQVALYERTSGEQTDGMISLADKYHLKKMATAMNQRDGRTSSFYLSGYRAGKIAKSFDQKETEYLQCAVDQIGTAMKLSSMEETRSIGAGEVTIFVNEDGIGILGLGQMRDELGNFWPEWTGDILPEMLRSVIQSPGQHFLVDRELVVTCEEIPKRQGMGLRKLTLRKMQPADMLTHREWDVAKALVEGESHKQVARRLGISPATVRNQTSAIYQKLEVGNRTLLFNALKGHPRLK